jgi:hypothetical protein
MENSLAEREQSQHRKRRRSPRKSGKQLYERRKKLKNIGWWVLIGVIGVVAVAGISVLAGNASR